MTALTVLRGVCLDLFATHRYQYVDRVGRIVRMGKEDRKGGHKKGTNQEYTSFIGGKIFLPPSCSRFRNFFSSRNSLLVTSSFNSFSQLSSSVSISNFSNSLCSSVNFFTHASLSNFTAAGESRVVSVPVPAAFVLEETVLGWPKNEVIEPSDLGFLESERGSSEALRLRDMVMLERRKRSRRDSLNFVKENSGG